MFEGTFLDSPKYPKLNEVLEKLAKEKNVTKSAIALSWILRIPGKMQAVIGTTSPKHLKEAAQATSSLLNRKEWYQIYLTQHPLP
jgi:predicted oxidoreductase